MKEIKDCKSVEELLSSPARWCQNSTAQNQRNESVSCHEKTCEKFCLIGSVWRIYGYMGENCSRVEGLLRGEIDGSISNWNDAPERTYLDVINLVRKLKI